MPKHALLSASSSDRWIHCPPSARLSETYEDKGSDYAAEGTDAHSLCEYKLKKALGMEADDPTEHLSWFNQEMDDHATGYAAYVLEQVEAAKESCSDPVVLIEQRVDFSRWVEEGFGTADCIVIADGTLQIIDFKYGLGVLLSRRRFPTEYNIAYLSCCVPNNSPGYLQQLHRREYSTPVVRVSKHCSPNQKRNCLLK